ncbi:hypothetical protein, partial [Pseudomonas sp. SWRI81]|uniref:hypothetical protein n=1 Tax=Pseudomonas sp. SWRI81 TaxID=2745505 RepID=UPI001EE393BF
PGLTVQMHSNVGTSLVSQFKCIPMWERACSRKGNSLNQTKCSKRHRKISRLHAGKFPLTIRAHRSPGFALLPTLSANGNTRYEYVTTTTPKVERLCHTRPLQQGPRMNRIVNLPMALRRSKLRHSARPPDIAC